MVLRDPSTLLSVYGMVPLQAQEATNALFDSLLGTLIEFGMIMFVAVLSIASIFLLGMAGIANMSEDTNTQNKVSGYVMKSAICLVAAIMIGIMPLVLFELGFESMQYIDPIDWIAG